MSHHEAHIQTLLLDSVLVSSCSFSQTRYWKFPNHPPQARSLLYGRKRFQYGRVFPAVSEGLRRERGRGHVLPVIGLALGSDRKTPSERAEMVLSMPDGADSRCGSGRTRGDRSSK